MPVAEKQGPFAEKTPHAPPVWTTTSRVWLEMQIRALREHRGRGDSLSRALYAVDLRPSGPEVGDRFSRRTPLVPTILVAMDG